MCEKEKDTAKVSLRLEIEDLQGRLKRVTDTEVGAASGHGLPLSVPPSACITLSVKNESK